jgi:hypothetical protein
LALAVEIAATGFCHPDGILQLFLSTRSANFAAADSSSSQIATTDRIRLIISFGVGRLHRQTESGTKSVTRKREVIIIVFKSRLARSSARSRLGDTSSTSAINAIADSTVQC